MVLTSTLLFTVLQNPFTIYKKYYVMKSNLATFGVYSIVFSMKTFYMGKTLTIIDSLFEIKDAMSISYELKLYASVPF